MKLLEPYQTQDKLVFMADSPGNMSRKKNKKMPNHLIYAPYPNMPILREMLNKIDQKKPRIWQFGRELFLGQFTEPIQLNMQKCVKHLEDWSWYQESNQVLNHTLPGKKQFSKKLITKKQVNQERYKLENELQQEKKKIVNLNIEIIKLNDQNHNFVKQFLSEIKRKASKKIDLEDEQNVNEIDYQAKEEEGLKLPSISQVNEKMNELLLRNSLRQNEKQQLKSKMIELRAQKSHLQFERNVGVSIFGGMMFTIVIIMLVMIRSLRKQKNSLFKNLNSTEISMTEESKLSHK